MTREQAVKSCRAVMDSNGLNDWHIRLTTDIKAPYGLCSYVDKCIILNAHSIDTHPDNEITDTILHEVAHALTPGAAHNDVWKVQAIKLGAKPLVCATYSLSPELINMVRSGATINITFEESLEEVIEHKLVKKPKYEITRLQDKCEVCGAVAKIKNELLVPSNDEDKPDEKFLFLECGHLIIKKISKGTPFHTLIAKDNGTCKHDWNKNKCFNCEAMRPFPFQVEGMQFIEAALSINKGAAIFDEMGLGKTIQSLGYIKFHPEAWPVLYIVKSSIKFQWFKEVITWLGDSFVGQIIERSEDILIPGLRSYFISYDMLVFKTRKSKHGKTINQGFDISKFDGVIKTVILDECQLIKNPDSSRTQQVRRIVKDKNVIALSGTPWKNRGSEFFSVLNMMAPMKFPSYNQYINYWVEKYWDGNKQKEGGIRNPVKFREYIKDIAIRREISQVAIEMPEVNRTRLDIQLDDLSQTTYDGEVSDFVKWYNQFVIDGTEDQINGMQILAKLSRMRHITGLAKIEATVAFAEQFFEETERKLCVFVHHIDVGSILYDNFQKQFGEQIPIFHLTGDQSDLERFQIQEAFNKAERAFLVASTLAAGEGMNLQTCGDAIMHEKQWNPQNEDQAAPGRFRRIGATHKMINVTHTLAEGTVDDILYGIVERKRGQFHNGMNVGEEIKWVETDIAKELAQGIVQRFKAKNKGKAQEDKKLSQLLGVK